MIRYRNKLIRILECWNGEEPDVRAVDLIRRFQQPRPIEGMYCREFYTILIDLRQDQTRLLAGMKRDTRYDIRRAAGEGFSYEFYNGKDAGVFNEFCEFYDEFAIRVRQPKLRRDWLALLAASNTLLFSRVAETGGPTLVWHGYLCGQSRVTLLYSASSFTAGTATGSRNRMGRAHRYQHWQDLLRFKDNQISLYDFGGWYHGQDDQKRLQINRFKEEFGGEVVRNYICERPLTLRGGLFLRLRQWRFGDAI
jgi:hypothetical protein